MKKRKRKEIEKRRQKKRIIKKAKREKRKRNKREIKNKDKSIIPLSVPAEAMILPWLILAGKGRRK